MMTERLWLVGWFAGFYGISTILGYLMSNHVYAYISNMYIIYEQIMSITFLNEPELFSAHS